MPGPLAKVRVLMFGTDEALLRIRSKVLATVGCETDLIHSVEEARQALTAGKPKPALLLICHTADEEPADQVRSLAVKMGIPTYCVERLVPPQQLVADVNSMLRESGPHSKAASGRTSG